MANISDTNSIDPDKRILQKNKIKLSGYDVRHEIWSWEEYRTESLIFENDNIAGLTDQEIEALVIKSDLIKEGSDIAFHRLEEFTFVIFNFQVATNTEFELDKT